MLPSNSYKLRQRKGFSLIETLMVVSVIGIIATIAIPLLLNARRASLDEKARACLRSLATAQQNYFVAEGHFGSIEDLASSVPPYLDSRFASGELGHGFELEVSTSDRGLRFSAQVSNPGGNYDFSVDETFVVRNL